MPGIINFEKYRKQNVVVPEHELRGKLDKKKPEEFPVFDSVGDAKINLLRIVREEITDNKTIEKVIGGDVAVCKMLLEIKKKDEITFEHVLRVTENVMTLIEANGQQLDSLKSCELILAAMLHDIGKTNDEINEVVKTPGKLNKEQRAIMEEHPRKAFDRLMKLGYEEAAEIAVRHHEVSDNYPRSDIDQGYDGPERRQVKPEVDKAARILAISDVFDALINKRPYKEAMFIDQCEKILREKFRKEEDQKNISILVDDYKNQNT